MNRIHHINHIGLAVLLSLSVSILTGCVKDSDPDRLPSLSQGISVTFSLSGMDTKATSPGEDALGENAVLSAAVWIWRQGRTDEAAVFSSGSMRLSGNTASAFVPGDVLSAISADGGNAHFLLVANHTAIAPEGTLAEVLSTTQTTAFPSGGVQSSFTMQGEGAASLSGDGRILSGAVTLERCSSRIEVRITEIAESVEGEDGNYIPDLDHMFVVFHNGMSGGPLGGDMTASSRMAFQRQEGPLVEVAAGGSSYYTTTVPFYSWASDWSRDEELSADFLLIVPWSNDGGTSWKQSYYQIPINAYGLKMEPNTRYVLNMRIGIVGSFEEVLPVQLTPSVLVQPWGTFDMEGSSILESRYLVVSNSEVVMDNVEEASVQFASSHDCMIYSKRLTRANLLDGSTDVISESEYTLEMDSAAGTVTFSHGLDNSGTEDSDFAPYILTVVIGHSDNAAYTQVITFEQQPMIYVVAQENSDGTSSSHYGYTYINNGSKSSLGNGGNGLTGSNKNPNMYVISLSSFEEGSSYTIGDPRVGYVDNLPGVSGTSLTYTWAQTAPDINGNRRRISYYHPTESGDRTKNMVAPKFRVASSYGACNSQTYNNMQRRCASYQEDGYPAGRWRIPTAAEVLYIMSLSAQNIIPELFTIGVNDSDGYWCANGWIGGDSTGTPTLHENAYSGNNYVRCVYDEWFWGPERLSNISQFTWGDVDY